MNAIPCLKYRDAHAAAEWLERALGFERKAFHEEDGKVVHAEMAFGDGRIMFGSVDAGAEWLAKIAGRACVYLIAEDVDTLFERARAAGAEVLREPTDEDFGARDFAVADPEGNVFSVGTYRPE